MSYIYAALALQSLCCLAAGVENKPFCAAAQKFDPPAVAVAYEQVQIHG
jgi:hypothetical protein